MSYVRGQLLDLVGQKFGSWTVVSRHPENTAHGAVRWSVRCDCGTEAVHQGGNLKTGNAKHCGCLRPESSAGFSDHYYSYRWNAARRGHVFELTSEQFRKLVEANCHYCAGEPACSVRGTRRWSVPVFFNGIDRQDNSEGYTAENSVTCCKFCNLAKHNSTLADFEAYLNRVARRYGASL